MREGGSPVLELKTLSRSPRASEHASKSLRKAAAFGSGTDLASAPLRAGQTQLWRSAQSGRSYRSRAAAGVARLTLEGLRAVGEVLVFLVQAMSCWCWQRMTTHTRRWAHLCRWRLAAAPATATKRARSGCCSSAGGLPPLYPICHYTLSAYVPHLLASWLLSAPKSNPLISPRSAELGMPSMGPYTPKTKPSTPIWAMLHLRRVFSEVSGGAGIGSRVLHTLTARCSLPSWMK